MNDLIVYGMILTVTLGPFIATTLAVWGCDAWYRNSACRKKMYLTTLLYITSSVILVANFWCICKLLEVWARSL